MDILKNGNRPEDFREQAEALCELAEEVDMGKHLCVAWLTIWRDDEGKVVWQGNHFKAKGISAMEVYGTMMLQAAEYARDHLRDED